MRGDAIDERAGQGQIPALSPFPLLYGKLERVAATGWFDRPPETSVNLSDPMKHRIIYLAAAAAISTLCAAERPPELIDARKQYDAALSAATKPVRDR